MFKVVILTVMWSLPALATLCALCCSIPLCLNENLLTHRFPLNTPTVSGVLGKADSNT